RSLRDPERRARFVARQLAVSPEADRRVLAEFDEEAILAAAVDAFRAGSRGAAQEMTLFARPWGFDLSDIVVPVELWHGSDDVNVPVAVARHVARHLPQCTSHILDGEGHSVGLARRDDVMASVVAAAHRNAHRSRLT